MLLALQQAPPAVSEQEITIVEPRRSPWQPPSGVSHFTERKVAGWRVLTWTDDGPGDRIVRLQRWRKGYTLIYQRWYLSGGAEASDRAGIVVGNCAQGDRVSEAVLTDATLGEVEAALREHLARCGVAADAADRMLQGFERAYSVVIARSDEALAGALGDE